MFVHPLKADGLPAKTIRSLMAISASFSDWLLRGRAAGTVWGGLPFRGDAFEPELAGVAKNCVALALPICSLKRMPVGRYVTRCRNGPCTESGEGGCPPIDVGNGVTTESAPKHLEMEDSRGTSCRN